MKVFVSTDHDGYYPVGTASVVIASCVQEAVLLLDIELAERGLKRHTEHPYALQEISMEEPRAYVLRDGNY